MESVGAGKRAEVDKGRGEDRAKRPERERRRKSKAGGQMWLKERGGRHVHVLCCFNGGCSPNWFPSSYQMCVVCGWRGKGSLHITRVTL